MFFSIRILSVRIRPICVPCLPCLKDTLFNLCSEYYAMHFFTKKAIYLPSYIGKKFLGFKEIRC